MKLTRRKLLSGASIVVIAGAAGLWAATRRGEQPHLALPVADASKQYNILLITSDQERAWSYLPNGFIETYCPGRSRLLSEAMSFTRAFTPTPICSTARACLYTGQHSQKNGLWENVPLPYAPNMKRSVPTLGTLMSGAGYHTAYFGKWHLSRLERSKEGLFSPEEVKNEILSYGWDETGTTYEIDGPLGGANEDELTTNEVVEFLERDHSQADKPWFTSVNLLNPHDIMFYTAGPEMTASRVINYPHDLARPPLTPVYADKYDYPLPENFGLKERKGSVPAAEEYRLCDEYALGVLPFDNPEVCKEYVDYYYNCMRDNDRYIERLLDTLERTGQADNTIVIFTSDHGEMLGTHGLRNKGVLPFRETVQVPFLVRHPDHPERRETNTLTSHIDIAPTLLAFAGVPREQVTSTLPGLVGEDISPVILGTTAKGPTDDEKGILLHWTSFAYQDHQVVLAFKKLNDEGGKMGVGTMLKPEFRGMLKKRGQMRGVFDGRYKFARFFAPTDHNMPESWDDLTAMNDLELYDTLEDPGELTNLAADPDGSKELVLAMNAKLNALLRAEVGVDDGRHLPGPGFMWKA